MALLSPCERCRQLETTCSFETDSAPGPGLATTPTNVAQVLVDLMKRYVTKLMLYLTQV